MDHVTTRVEISHVHFRFKVTDVVWIQSFKMENYSSLHVWLELLPADIQSLVDILRCLLWIIPGRVQSGQPDTKSVSMYPALPWDHTVQITASPYVYSYLPMAKPHCKSPDPLSRLLFGLVIKTSRVVLRSTHSKNPRSPLMYSEVFSKWTDYR